MIFGKNIIKSEKGCWVWQKSKAGNGYGKITFYKRQVYVHRAMYRIFYGEIPSGMMVMHSCDNPSCVNPEHLSLGTAKDNVRDMLNKDRGMKNWSFFRERNPKTKFTKEKKEEMLREYDEGMPIKVILQEYSISHAQFFRIRKKRGTSERINKSI